MTPEELLVQQASGNYGLSVFAIIAFSIASGALLYARFLRPLVIKRRAAAAAKSVAARPVPPPISGATGTPPTPPTAPAVVPPVSEKGWGWSGLWMLILILIVGAVIYYFYRQGTFEDTTLAWSTSTGVIIAFILAALALVSPKEPWKWVRPTLWLIACGVVLVTLVFSGAAAWLIRSIDGVDECLARDDCTLNNPQRAERVIEGQPYVIGTNWLTFRKIENECIWFPPSAMGGFEWNSDRDEYRIRSLSGDRVLSFRIYNVGEVDEYGNVCGGSTASARK